jgi:hypothetical protein
VSNGCSELHGWTTGTYQTGKDLTNASNGPRHDLHLPLMSDSGPIIIFADKKSVKSYWHRWTYASTAYVFIQFTQPFSSSRLSIWFAYSYRRGTWRVRIRKAVLPPLADSLDMTSIPSCQLIKRNEILQTPTGRLIRLPFCRLRKLQAYQKDTHSRFNRFIPAR